MHRRRYREEPEVARGEPVESAQMFHYRDVGTKENGMGGAHGILRVVNVQGVDADECRFGPGKERCGVGSEEGVTGKISFRSPVPGPSRVDQDCAPGNTEVFENFTSDGSFRFGAHCQAVKVGKGGKGKIRNISRSGIPMERGIHVGAGVGNKRHLADVEGRSAAVPVGRILTCPEIRDLGSGQARVRDHAVADGMAQVNEAECRIHGGMAGQRPGRGTLSPLGPAA